MKTWSLLCLWATMLMATGITLAQTWEWQSPVPQGSSLYNVQMFPGGSGVAVGGTGAIVRTTDYGDTWIAHNSGVNAFLDGMSFISSTEGWTFGQIYANESFSTTVYYTADGGFTWEERATLNDCATKDILFLNSNMGFLAGRNSSYGACVCRTTDGGHTWQRIVYDAQSEFESLYFLDAMNGWVTGYSVMRTTDGGLTWNAANFDNFFPERRIQFFDAMNGVGIDMRDFYRTTDGGIHWSETPLPGAPGSISAWDITFIDQDIGWMACGHGQILSTTDGGMNWNIHSTGIDDYFLSISAVTSQTVAVAGENGRIVTTHDGGSTWSLTAGQRITERNFYAVDFADENTGWAVGGDWNGSRVIVKTTDGGQQWVSVVDNPDSTALSDVAVPDPDHVWISGGYPGLMHSTNDGETWSVQPLPDSRYGGHLQFFNADSGWTMSGNRLMYTTNSGEEWHLVGTDLPPETSDFFFLNMSNGWVFGGKPATIDHTTDGGLTWTRQFCDDIFGETSTADVWFSDPMNGWAVVWNAGLLHTTDGGQSWNEVVIGSSLVDCVTMSWTDADHGWVLSYYQRPIVYTTDGGVTWLESSLPMDSPAMDMDFANADNGWVVGWNGNIIKWRGAASPIGHRANGTMPKMWSLSAYPNPFNPVVNLQFSVPVNGQVSLAIYDVTGRLVQTVADRVMPAGEHRELFDGSQLPSGIYFARLQGQTFASTQKLILLK